MNNQITINKLSGQLKRSMEDPMAEVKRLKYNTIQMHLHSMVSNRRQHRASIQAQTHRQHRFKNPVLRSIPMVNL